MDIGKEVKRLRKISGLSQNDLSKGICTQAQISKIEKGQVIPLATTLFEISKRLGVSIDYFFSFSMNPRFEYVEEFFHFIRVAIKKKEYSVVSEMLKAEKQNPLFSKNLFNQQFILWHEGICAYHLENDALKALKILNDALETTNNYKKKLYSEREIEILNSIGIIYLEIKKFTEAYNTFEKAIKLFEELPYKDDYNILIRLLYNSAKSCTKLKKYDYSISKCQKGIGKSKEIHSMYLLGELHFQIAYNYLKKEDIYLSDQYFEKSLPIFSIQNRQDYIDHINRHFINKEELPL